VGEAGLSPAELLEDTAGTTDEWELNRSDLTLGVVLGSGNFGEVRMAKLNCPWGATIDVAVKMAKVRYSLSLPPGNQSCQQLDLW
jgi:hypothetical protein